MERRWWRRACPGAWEASWQWSRTVADETPNPSGPFDAATVKALVGLMSRFDLHEIDLRPGEARIRLLRGAPLQPAAAPTAFAVAPPAPAAAPAAAKPAAADKPAAS